MSGQARESYDLHSGPAGGGRGLPAGWFEPVYSVYSVPTGVTNGRSA